MDGLYSRALITLGEAHQTDRCIEEMGELTAALLQHRKGAKPLEKVVEELADVRITTAIMKLYVEEKGQPYMAVYMDKLAKLERFLKTRQYE